MIYGHGGDIYTYQDMLDFSVNVNPLGAPEGAVRAAEKGAGEMAAYPDSRCRKLRAKLSRMQGIPGEHYLFGNGAADLIYRLVLAEKPKRALIPVPAFSEYEQALRTVRCDIIYYETKLENCFCIDDNFLKELERPFDMVFLCSPTNPSGKTIARELLAQTAELCERRGIRLVLDECFAGFLEDGDAASMLGETGHFRQLFLLRAFTKIYAMPGMRLGYGVSSDRELLERMEFAGQPWSVSIPAQEAGIAALDESAYVQEARRLVRVERSYLEGELEELGIKFVSSNVNFILLYSEINLFDALLDYGILIRDCGNYRGLKSGWYRIAVRRHEENRKLTDALREIFRRSPRQKTGGDGPPETNTQQTEIQQNPAQQETVQQTEIQQKTEAAG